MSEAFTEVFKAVHFFFECDLSCVIFEFDFAAAAHFQKIFFPFDADKSSAEQIRRNAGGGCACERV